MNAHFDPGTAGQPSTHTGKPMSVRPAVRQMSQPSIVASILAYDALAIGITGLATGGSWLSNSKMHWTAL
ncbi:MAG: hypothetical protein NWT00_06070, partial [Beijerinckiaceae bacterium]|nr:hypothetical protein [Beijerinckiaceae bacterium]